LQPVAAVQAEEQHQHHLLLHQVTAEALAAVEPAVVALAEAQVAVEPAAELAEARAAAQVAAELAEAPVEALAVEPVEAPADLAVQVDPEVPAASQLLLTHSNREMATATVTIQ